MSSERQLDDTNNPWWGEHIHRYEEAAKIITRRNSNVLDIACGTGFGSNFLAELGHNVIGADISEGAVNECNNKYKANNLSYEVIDGLKTPFQDEYFEAIVSFETIEHTTEYIKMLNEFKRVLKKDGVAIISTPNFLINSPDGYIVNPYHTQEWRYNELKEILESVFKNVEIFGQKYARYDTGKFNYKIGNVFEQIMYLRGVRKLPISFQDRIMKMVIKKPMYPTKDDYLLVSDVEAIKKCKTFFAICRK